MAIWKDFATIKTLHISDPIEMLEPVRYHYAFVIRGSLKKRGMDLPVFASYVYAYDLFAQVVYTFYREFQKPGQSYAGSYQCDSLALHSASLNGFPATTGFLSTAYARVCPAVLPMMLLYVDPPKPWERFGPLDWGSVVLEYSVAAKRVQRFRSRLRERECWLRHEEQIRQAVLDVSESVQQSLDAYHDEFKDVIDVKGLQEWYLMEHSRLDSSVKALDDSQRCVNGQAID
jgi:hypothetical protein